MTQTGSCAPAPGIGAGADGVLRCDLKDAGGTREPKPTHLDLVTTALQGEPSPGPRRVNRLVTLVRVPEQSAPGLRIAEAVSTLCMIRR